MVAPVPITGPVDAPRIEFVRDGAGSDGDDPMTTTGAGSRTIRATRWAARITGLLAAAFLLLMFTRYVLQGRNPVSASLDPFAALGLALMAVHIAAIVTAIRWERVGTILGAISLGAFFVILYLGLLPGNVSGGLSARGVLNPLFLALWLPILLFQACWLLERRAVT